MRSAIYIPALVSGAVVALIVAFQTPATAVLPQEKSADESRLIELLVDIEPYEDIDYGFTVAVPTGWQKIVSVESDEEAETLEPGYAVGFESPNQGNNDKFADYILIEILPGSDTGTFTTDGSNRLDVLIDGRPAWIDRLDVNGASAGLDDVDLTVYQAEMIGLGYTVGLYAIGEVGREALMSAAFEVMVRTFHFTEDPFDTV